MQQKVIMPMGTAFWLIRNTKLTDRQIAEFCQITIRDVLDMRSERIKICPVDPIHYTQQLNMEMIEKCTKDPNMKLEVVEDNNIFSQNIPKQKKEKAYMPTKLRKEKKIIILTLIKKYPIIEDKDIHHLMNITTKTVANYRKNFDEIAANLNIGDNIEIYLSLNPFWREIKKKYNLK